MKVLDLQVGSGLGCCGEVVGALLEEEGLVGEGDCLHWELAGVFEHQGSHSLILRTDL